MRAFFHVDGDGKRNDENHEHHLEMTWKIDFAFIWVFHHNFLAEFKEISLILHSFFSRNDDENP